jgi:hypothetical protein
MPIFKLPKETDFLAHAHYDTCAILALTQALEALWSREASLSGNSSQATLLLRHAIDKAHDEIQAAIGQMESDKKVSFHHCGMCFDIRMQTANGFPTYASMYMNSVSCMMMRHLPDENAILYHAPVLILAASGRLVLLKAMKKGTIS